GYSYGNELYARPHLKITYSKNDVANIKMLIAGRIDAVLGDHATTLEAIQSLKAQDYVKYDPKFKLAVMDVFWVFQNDTKGLELCRSVSKAISSLKANKPGVLFFDGIDTKEEL
ncbi:hypothetical protein, partial [Candidatus Pelagadaptatus aseana]|uniref:hypothetical protein n=1 Tax=Candidatus Pelagadaptatus aseana TaxID=3120508 RepID=UPI003C6F54A0